MSTIKLLPFCLENKFLYNLLRFIYIPIYITILIQNTRVEFIYHFEPNDKRNGKFENLVEKVAL